MRPVFRREGEGAEAMRKEDELGGTVVLGVVVFLACLAVAVILAVGLFALARAVL